MSTSQPISVAQRQQLALPDPRGAQRRQVVAPPLLRHADAHRAQAHDVLDVAVVALHLDGREDQRALLVDVPGGRHVRRRLGVADVGLVGLRQHGEAVPPGSSITGTRIEWSAGCEQPWYGELWRNASPRSRRGWSSSIDRAIRSGPAMTWMGRLSPTAMSRASAVRMQHEKSRPLLMTPERAVRRSVFCIRAAMPSIRRERTASLTPSTLPASPARPGPRLAWLAPPAGSRRDHQASPRRAPRPPRRDRPRPSSTGDSTMTGPGYETSHPGLQARPTAAARTPADVPRKYAGRDEPRVAGAPDLDHAPDPRGAQRCT